MKITETGRDTLRLDYDSWALSLVTLGFTLVMVYVAVSNLLAGKGLTMFIGVAIGIGVLAAVTERTQLWADRRADTFTLRRRSAFGRDERVLALSDIVRAEVEVHKGRKGGESYRPILVMRDGNRLPLREGFTGGQDARTAVDVINIWLAEDTGAIER